MAGNRGSDSVWRWCGHGTNRRGRGLSAPMDPKTACKSMCQARDHQGPTSGHQCVRGRKRVNGPRGF